MPAVAQKTLQKTSQSRVFTIEGGAGPANAPVYQSLARAMAVSWPQGDVTPVRIPDPDQYESFVVVDQIKGQQGLPTLGLQFRKDRSLSDLLTLVRKGCAFDVQVHVGACKTPSDFNEGWELIQVFELASITSYDTDELGALDADQNAVVNEAAALTGLDYYELKPLAAQEQAASEVVQEVVDVSICDSKTCGECGLPTDGCQKVFALTKSHGGSPGLPAEIVFTEDGGGSFLDTNITTLPANMDPDAMACVGIHLVVVSNEDCAIHYAEIAEILDAAETWTRVTTGLVCAAGAPNDLFSLGRTFTWIVGDGGYIYFSSDITAGVDVQTAGSVTVQNLTAIHGYDTLNLVAVGASNTILLTRNGGSTWAAVTGPAALAGITLNTVFMRSKDEWFIGSADGHLYYTRDGGATWTEKAFPGSGSGVVRDITFPTPTVGYLSHDTAAARARILRSIDGGHSWYVLPEGTLSLPLADQINAIAACREDPNLVWGGGLGDNAVDGFLVKAA